MLTVLTFARVYSRCLARKDAILLTVLFFFAKKSSQKVCVFPDKCVPLHSQIRNEAQNKHRGVEQLVARQAHNLEVTCSSRVSATILKRCKEIPYTSFSFVVRLLLVSRSVWADVCLTQLVIKKLVSFCRKSTVCLQMVSSPLVSLSITEVVSLHFTSKSSNNRFGVVCLMIPFRLCGNLTEVGSLGSLLASIFFVNMRSFCLVTSSTWELRVSDFHQFITLITHNLIT